MCADEIVRTLKPYLPMDGCVCLLGTYWGGMDATVRILDVRAEANTVVLQTDQQAVIRVANPEGFDFRNSCGDRFAIASASHVRVDYDDTCAHYVLHGSRYDILKDGNRPDDLNHPVRKPVLAF